MKSSFKKPGAAAAPTKPAAKAPVKPTPKAPVKPPTKAAPQPPTKPAAKAPPKAAAPQRQAPPAKPTPQVKAPPQRQAPAPPPQRRAPAPPPPQDPPEEQQEQQEEVIEAVAEVVEEAGNAGGGHVAEGAELEVVDEDRGAVAQVGASIFGGQAGSITGEIGMQDFAVPKLKLAQNVGPLTEELGFTSGDWVFADEVILWQPECAEFEITIIRAHKNFVEKTEYGSGEMGRIFETLQEAADAGLETNWGPNNEPPQTMPQFNLLLLITLPDGVESGLFNLEGPDQRRYALALWRVSGTAYGPVVQKITGAARTRLAAGLHTGTFKVSAKKVKGKVNTYWQPVLNPGEAHDEQVIEFVAAQLGAGEAAE
jgi:hypothetical protein